MAKTTSLFRSRLLSIFCLILCSTTIFSQDLLDKVESGSKLVHELKDMYRSYKIYLVIADQKELVRLYLNEEDEEGLDPLIGEFIPVCNSLEKIHFNNDTLGSLARQYVSLTIQNYRIGKEKGFGSKEFEKDLAHYRKEREKYMQYMAKTFPTDSFIKFTEEEYWKTIDKKNYITSPAYAKYDGLKATDINAALALLDEITAQTAEFQEYNIYQLESADQCVKKSDSLDFGDDLTGYDVAIQKYKSVIDQEKYSLYLFETWVKWRVVTQQWTGGLSKSSDIPNNEYDKVREQVAAVILNYIATHENDEMAINEFMLIASHDIIKRFGAYPYGNQNTVEYHRLFDE